MRFVYIQQLWLELIDRLQIKAFCDVMVVTGARRAGVQASAFT